MAIGATPKIRLSLSEWGQIVVAFFAFAWPMLKALFGNAPWKMFGSIEEKRAYWRNVALVLIRTGGYWFSIRHLQFIMPSTTNTVRLWSWMHGVDVTTEEVELARDNAGSSDERNPWIHWIGAKPLGSGKSTLSAITKENRSKAKVFLHIHGGGFVLPLSNGCISMTKSFLHEAKAAECGVPVYLALAEYTISPYAEHPTQIRQCIAIIQFLHSEYGIESSNLVLAGDSGGASLCLSLISHFMHPSPTLPSFPYTMGVNAPLAGVLLMSPWTAFATTSPSYTSNADLDTLPPNVIRRFRDTYMPGSSLLPPSSYKFVDPMQIASLSGRHYEPVSDPPIRGLEYGAGAIRPLDSFTNDKAEEDEWWNNIGDVARKVIITAGDHECFRDDIVSFAKHLQRAAQAGSHHGRGAVMDDQTAAEVVLVTDESYHGAPLADFAFGMPPDALALTLSTWLGAALRA